MLASETLKIALAQNAVKLYTPYTEYMKTKQFPSVLKPTAWPRSGPVRRLYLNFASGGFAVVYAEQSQWPRQKSNPNWRIVVDRIDARYDLDTRKRIHQACLEAARQGLCQWLTKAAPALTLETATWHELVRFSTRSECATTQRINRRSHTPLRILKRHSRLTSQLPIEPLARDPD